MNNYKKVAGREQFDLSAIARQKVFRDKKFPNPCILTNCFDTAWCLEDFRTFYEKGLVLDDRLLLWDSDDRHVRINRNQASPFRVRAIDPTRQIDNRQLIAAVWVTIKRRDPLMAG